MSSDDYKMMLSRRVHKLRVRIAGNPGNPALYQELGFAQLKQGNLEAARAAYEAGLEVNPDNPWLRLYYGNYFYKTGALEQALKQFHAARELMPELALPVICIGDVYHRMNRMKVATKCYRIAMETEPDCELAQRNLLRWNKILSGEVLNLPKT